jgi:hypothetical protein
MRCAGYLGALCVVAGFATSKPVRAQQAPSAEVDAEKRERAALLAQVLPEAVRRRSLTLFPPLVIATGGLMGGLGVAARSPALVAGGAVDVASGIAFYLMPEQRNYELLIAGSEASAGFFYWGLPLDSPHERWQIPIGAAHMATSALLFINTAYSTHPGRTRLSADLARVRTPAARSSLSVAELQQIERDLYGTDPFVPQWVLGLPLMVGSVAAAAPLLDRDVSARDKPVIGAFAALNLVTGLAFSLTPTIADEYRTSLERAGLWAKWSVGPGGVGVVGGFD